MRYQSLLTKTFLKLFLCSMLTGCSTFVYKTTGEAMHNVGQDLIIPYILSTPDPQMACSSAEANTPLIMGFEKVDVDTSDLAISMMLTAGACEQNRAFDEELRYLRALHRQDPTTAEDARSAQKTLLAAAARRQLAGYRAYEHYFAESIASNQCPEFESDQQELAWLMGNLVGVQAMVNDGASDMVVQVPRNIAAKTERAMDCLDNEKWWGMPLALRAAVWSTLPGLTPEGQTAEQAFEQASTMGAEQGVRMADALWAITAHGQGNAEQMRSVIRQHATTSNTKTANSHYALFDAISTHIIQQMSDRLWTQNHGHRTPYNQLGQFGDEHNAISEGPTIDVDDLI